MRRSARGTVRPVRVRPSRAMDCLVSNPYRERQAYWLYCVRRGATHCWVQPRRAMMTRCYVLSAYSPDVSAHACQAWLVRGCGAGLFTRSGWSLGLQGSLNQAPGIWPKDTVVQSQTADGSPRRGPFVKDRAEARVGPARPLRVQAGTDTPLQQRPKVLPSRSIRLARKRLNPRRLSYHVATL